MMTEQRHFIEGINAKVEEAWKHLYADYYSSLCCYALRILKDPELARDVVQGVIVRLWEAEVHFPDLPSFQGYLYKAVYHNSLQMLRDRHREEHLIALGKADAAGEEWNYGMIEEEVIRRLRRVIEQMPEKRREVMLLCLEEKKVEEIARILGISENTVKKHKKEAYEFIRQQMPSDPLILFLLLCYSFR